MVVTVMLMNPVLVVIMMVVTRMFMAPAMVVMPVTLRTRVGVRRGFVVVEGLVHEASQYSRGALPQVCKPLSRVRHPPGGLLRR